MFATQITKATHVLSYICQGEEMAMDCSVCMQLFTSTKN